MQFAFVAPRPLTAALRGASSCKSALPTSVGPQTPALTSRPTACTGHLIARPGVSPRILCWIVPSEAVPWRSMLWKPWVSATHYVADEMQQSGKKAKLWIRIANHNKGLQRKQFPLSVSQFKGHIIPKTQWNAWTRALQGAQGRSLVWPCAYIPSSRKRCGQTPAPAGRKSAAGQEERGTWGSGALIVLNCPGAHAGPLCGSVGHPRRSGSTRAPGTHSARRPRAHIRFHVPGMSWYPPALLEGTSPKHRQDEASLKHRIRIWGK